MKYLKVEIEGKFTSSDITAYTPLDPLTEYSDVDLRELGQEIVNNELPWGYEVVDEDDVPEGERL